MWFNCYKAVNSFEELQFLPQCRCQLHILQSNFWLPYHVDLRFSRSTIFPEMIQQFCRVIFVSIQCKSLIASQNCSSERQKLYSNFQHEQHAQTLKSRVCKNGAKLKNKSITLIFCVARTYTMTQTWNSSIFTDFSSLSVYFEVIAISSSDRYETQIHIT